MRGLKHCTNEWVFRMDTDDICEPYRFEKQIKFILDNSNLVIVGGQIAEFNQHKDDIVSYRNVPLSAKDIVKLLVGVALLIHMTVAYKKVPFYLLVVIKIYKKIIIYGLI